jgi:hypothetical protein
MRLDSQCTEQLCRAVTDPTHLWALIRATTICSPGPWISELRIIPYSLTLVHANDLPTALKLSFLILRNGFHCHWGSAWPRQTQTRSALALETKSVLKCTFGFLPLGVFFWPTEPIFRTTT